MNDIIDKEHETVNHRVGGSNPSQGANINGLGMDWFHLCAIESDLCYSPRVGPAPIIAIFSSMILAPALGVAGLVWWLG